MAVTSALERWWNNRINIDYRSFGDVTAIRRLRIMFKSKSRESHINRYKNKKLEEKKRMLIEYRRFVESHSLSFPHIVYVIGIDLRLCNG